MAFRTDEPPSAQTFQTDRLAAYLREQGPAVFAEVEDLQLHPLTEGQSNPTFVLRSGELTWVLRKKPSGPLLPSAHQIEREWTVLKALSQTHVPVPQVVHFCSDASVLGTAFYIMEHVKGTVFLDNSLPSLIPDHRSQIYRSAVETLGALHSVDVASLGLQDFGRAAGYAKRQIQRWWRQYEKSTPQTDRGMADFRSWLMSHLPASDATPDRSMIMHGMRVRRLSTRDMELGDYQLRNLIFVEANGEWRVQAVVDWELSTLGSGWADLAYACLPFYGPPLQHHSQPVDPSIPGIPTEDAVVKIYAAAREIELPGGEEWAFCKALALFRLAAICQGVAARAAQGNAASDVGAEVGSAANIQALIQRGLQIAQGSGRPVRAPSKVLVPSEFDWAGFPVRPFARVIVQKLTDFMETYVIPLESSMEAHVQSSQKWNAFPPMEELKKKAKDSRLWNLFVPPSMGAGIRHIEGLSPVEADLLSGVGLTNVEYAFVAERMGRCLWASEVFNCSAPDTGNMEILAQYEQDSWETDCRGPFGTAEQKVQWLVPLLRGEIRSCFAMTEKLVASSDATNIESRIERRGEVYTLSGKKWWTSGAMHPLTKLCIFMGKTDLQQPVYKQQSMILVPFDHPGVRVQRPMLCFGYDDAPVGHAEVHFDDVAVPVAAVLGREGQGFEIAQSRLGPGRLHHCMRLIGLGKRGLDLAKRRVHERATFGTPLAENASVQLQIGECVVQLRAARLLTLSAAATLDAHGGKTARGHIAAAKIFVPRTVCALLDRAIQLHGGTGLSNDYPLAQMYSATRSLRIADGPDEVHLSHLGRMELTHSKL